MGETYFVREFGLVAGLDYRAKVLAFDLKGTGDLSPLALFAHAYSVGDEPEDIAVQLDWMRWARAEVTKRARLIRDLPLDVNPEKGEVTDALAAVDQAKYGPVVILADECQTWFQHPDKAIREDSPGSARTWSGRARRWASSCCWRRRNPTRRPSRPASRTTPPRGCVSR